MSSEVKPFHSRILEQCLEVGNALVKQHPELQGCVVVPVPQFEVSLPYSGLFVAAAAKDLGVQMLACQKLLGTLQDLTRQMTNSLQAVQLELETLEHKAQELRGSQRQVNS